MYLAALMTPFKPKKLTTSTTPFGIDLVAASWTLSVCISTTISTSPSPIFLSELSMRSPQPACHGVQWHQNQRRRGLVGQDQVLREERRLVGMHTPAGHGARSAGPEFNRKCAWSRLYLAISEAFTATQLLVYAHAMQNELEFARLKIRATGRGSSHASCKLHMDQPRSSATKEIHRGSICKA